MTLSRPNEFPPCSPSLPGGCLSPDVSSTVADNRSETVTIAHAVIPTERLHHTRLVTGVWIVCTLFLAACVKPLEFPPLGNPLPASARLAAGGQEPAASMEPNQTPMGQLGAPSASTPPNLRFKATLRDENSNLIFEGGSTCGYGWTSSIRGRA